MKKPGILLISYYWPPSAGSGVQRWLKMSYFLQEMGWQVHVLCPENPDFHLRDPKLLADIHPDIQVHPLPIREPYQLWRRLRGQKGGDAAAVLEEKNHGLLGRAALFIRANLFIPDPRVSWVQAASAKGTALVKAEGIQALISTGPPHSMHLIARRIKAQTQAYWLADFRDPWTQWEFLQQLPMLPFARRKHARLELAVCREADRVCTISPTFQQELQARVGRPVSLLTNGFDPRDFPASLYTPADVKPGRPIRIVYTGIIDAIRNPFPFLEALLALSQAPEAPRFQVYFVGKVSAALRDFLEAHPALAATVHLVGYVAHEEVFQYYAQADLLLLILTQSANAKGNIPGKLFEYMATGRPVLALGDPKGDSAELLRAAGAGKVFLHSQSTEIQGFLRDFSPQAIRPLSESLNAYSRKALARKVSDWLREGLPAKEN
ncbi:group 1 glycosyl transferase [Nitritalea halalkaliphila LW7]|uniref:Group 1 glycosyl transferase n=1 Tax=Nitritalea halalkaliphila LW7 TaxID=1189621 RepID=I5C533_9BACT|nr:glycosyltransferase family 4 protein [Nitritalea halalkaliphila]EIM76935.1 group 1 glycosyl transferase [Nitritalea halalkaliphila LW7]